MFDNQNNGTEHLDELIETIEKLLDEEDPASKDYAAMAENLGRLLELKKFKQMAALDLQHRNAETQKLNRQQQVDPNVAVQTFGFLLATVLCIHAETVGTITTKAFSLIPRIMGIRHV